MNITKDDLKELHALMTQMFKEETGYNLTHIFLEWDGTLTLESTDWLTDGLNESMSVDIDE